MKLGSLFDGSGTAPLAAAMCGIEPVWASEIEPYPIKVTKARFPNMLHLGDITKINGVEVEPVDIICGGSPCQDLSVAGKQKGLQDGERSHLFFEMTRIIKQMREATNGKYPRYIIWENVPGAFGTRNGNDFHAVLQSFAEIANPNIHVPRPPRKGKSDRLDWRYAGSIVADGYSIAWRTMDAQYWGVPQRRRRIYAVASLATERASSILFDEQSVCRDNAQGEFEFKNYTGLFRTKPYGNYGIPFDATGKNSNSMKSKTPNSCFRARDVFRTLDTFSGTPECNQGGNVVCFEADMLGVLENQSIASGAGAFGTLMANAGTKLWLGNQEAFSGNYHIVEKRDIGKRVIHLARRLTPLECCRLQGFPDWWEDGVEGSDSERYKMWGNGMALPNMLHVMRGIARVEAMGRGREGGAG